MWNKIWKNLEWILLTIGIIVSITAVVLSGFGVVSSGTIFIGVLIAAMGIPFSLNAGR